MVVVKENTAENFVPSKRARYLSSRTQGVARWDTGFGPVRAIALNAIQRT